MTTTKAEDVKQLEQELKEARKIISDILKTFPIGTCCDFYHEKADQHTLDEPCPCVDRWKLAINSAIAFTIKP